MSGYYTVYRKLTSTQRATLNKRLKRAMAAIGEQWLPFEEFRRRKQEKEALKSNANKTEVIPVEAVPLPLPPLPTYEPAKIPDPLKEKQLKVPKGTVHPDVFRKLNLDAKIILFR